VRAIVALAVILSIARSSPTAAFAFERWYGERIAHGGIMLHLGAETFAARDSWSGGLGWLGAFADYAVSLGGRAATLLATMGGALVMLALVEERARRAAGALVALGAVLLVTACSIDGLRPGGGLESAVFAAALALLLERPGPRAALLATGIAIVWCNTGPQGLFASAIALAFAAGAVIERRDISQRYWAIVAFAGAAVATLATPAFFSYPALAFEGLRIDRAFQGLVAFHPSEVAPLAYRAGFMLIVFVALIAGAPRRAAGEAILVCFATLLALANGAYLPVFAVLVAPSLARSVASSWPRLSAMRLGWTKLVALGTICVLAVAMLAGAATTGLRPVSAASEIAPLVQLLDRDGRTHRLYCATPDWCGEAIAAGAPGVSVLMDGRIYAYPFEVRAMQLRITALKAHWRRDLSLERIDALLLRRDRAMATLMAATPGWRVAGSSATATLFERTGAAP